MPPRRVPFFVFFPPSLPPSPRFPHHPTTSFSKTMFLHRLLHLLLILSLIRSLYSTPASVPQSTLILSPPFSTFLVSESPSQPPQPSPSPRPPILDNLIQTAESLLVRQRDVPKALRLFRLATTLGHEGAATTLATLLLSADHCPRNILQAISALRFATAKGQPEAHALLGTLHASGIADRWGVEKSVPKALLHWRIAAGAENSYANLALAFRYKYGLDVPESCDEAAKYYQKAARAVATDPRYYPSPKNFQYGDPPLASSLMNVGRTRLTDDMFRRRGEVRGAGRSNIAAEEDEWFHYYTHIAEGGDLHSMTMLGSLLLTGGLGVDADVDHAREYLMDAAARGDGEAHGIMGHLEMRKGNYTGAVMHFQWSAAKMDRIGHYALGMVYFHGLLGMGKNLPRAKMHFELAAEKRHPEACFQLGVIYFRGQGTESDKKKAFEWFEKAAKLQNIQGMFSVGLILLEGNNPARRKDCGRAVSLLKQVAEEGEWNTLFDLASGKFEKRDWYGSLHRHLQAAHAGIELGQYNAAMILEKLEEGDIGELGHWGRERMLGEMHELYHMSGRQNRSESYLRSGDVAFLEKGDYATALEAYNHSANLHDPEGIFAVGMMYANGQGISLDRELALGQFALIREKGDQPAIAANLAVVGLKFYWWLCDMREWLTKVDKPVRLEMSEDGAGDEVGQRDGAADNVGIKYSSSTGVKTRRSIIGDDLAIVGGLLVILIAVLVVRSKRIARSSGNADDATHATD